MSHLPPDARSWDPGPALRRHLAALAGERSPLGSPERLRAAESHAEETLRGAGLVVVREPIAQSQGAWSNVIGDLPAAAPGSTAPVFIIGAHIDSVEGTPGADDNASGAAALLALAEWAGALARRPSSVTLRFAAFNLEEWGMIGSLEHADSLYEARRSVEGMISLEMIGYTDSKPGSQKYPPGMSIGRRKTGDFISVVGNTASRPLIKRVASALGKGGDLPVETAAIPAAAAFLIGASLSDHSSFWRRGFPAVMVGDTAFYRNPNYHGATDTIETLDLLFLEKVTRGLAVLLESMF